MRIGFVGCGRHATTSLYPALRPAGLELVAVCATRRARAEEAAQAWGAAAVDDLPALLGAGVDGIVVSVPPAEYRTIALAAIAAGIPVLMEKPGGASSTELREIDAAARAAGVPVMVGYMKRFAPAYRAALEYTRGDGFGPITSVHAKFVMGRGFGSLQNYVIDNPVHALDLMRCFGGEIDELEARVQTIDDNTHALSVLARYASGAVGTAQLGTTASFFQENEALDVIGVGHSVTVNNVDTVIFRPPSGPVEITRPTYTVPLPQNFTGTTMGFVPELEHFAAVVRGGAAVESDAASAATTLALAELLLTRLPV